MKTGSFNELRRQATQQRLDRLATGQPDQRRGPPEQRTPAYEPAPFAGGGRQANYPDRDMILDADADYNAVLARTRRQNRQNMGFPGAPLRKPHGPNT